MTEFEQKPVRRDDEPLAQTLWVVGSRLGIFPITFVCALVVTRTVVGGYGVDGFALYALVISLPALVPMADFGTGGAVLDAVSRDRTQEGQALGPVVITALRTLWVSGLAVWLVAAVLATLGVWNRLLDVADEAVNAAVLLAGAMWILTLWLALGYRILVGLGRAQIAVWLQASGSVAALLLVWGAVSLDAPLWVLPSLPFVAGGVPAAIALLLGLRWCGLTLTGCVRAAVVLSRRGARIRHVAGPVALITATAPLTFQSHRLFIAHFSSLDAVARYSAGSQLFAPLNGTISSAGQTLWPHFAAIRHLGGAHNRRALMRATAVYIALGVCAGAALVLLGPSITGWSTNGEARAPLALMISFGLLIVVVSAQYPFGMYLTTDKGLRLQALWAVATAAGTLFLALYLTPILGASGPLWAATTSFSIFMLFPSALVAWRWTGSRPNESVR